MDASRHQCLVVVVGFRWHLGEIKDKVSDVAEELILVDIPFCPLPAKQELLVHMPGYTAELTQGLLTLRECRHQYQQGQYP